MARAPVPVSLSVNLDERVSERLEVAAYYVVSESLANIGKHAQASSATVVVGRAMASSWSRSSTTGLEAPTPRAALASGGLPTGWRPSMGDSSVDSARRRNPRAGGDAMRVVIAEDSVLLREGLARLLTDEGFEVVAQCAIPGT